MFIGTRVFMAIVSYLVVLQIISPALQECPDGACLWQPLVWASQCGPSDYYASCDAYEYRHCGQQTARVRPVRPVQPVMVGK